MYFIIIPFNNHIKLGMNVNIFNISFSVVGLSIDRNVALKFPLERLSLYKNTLGRSCSCAKLDQCLIKELPRSREE